jgi:hypothetical protein
MSSNTDKFKPDLTKHHLGSMLHNQPNPKVNTLPSFKKAFPAHATINRRKLNEPRKMIPEKTAVTAPLIGKGAGVRGHGREVEGRVIGGEYNQGDVKAKTEITKFVKKKGQKEDDSVAERNPVLGPDDKGLIEKLSWKKK